MKICHVDPACGLDIPPKNWGAIEKIIWEFVNNQKKQVAGNLGSLLMMKPGKDIDMSSIGKIGNLLQKMSLSG